MNMAFSLTTKQMYSHTKFVTRRNGRVPKCWQVVQAIEKGQGIPKGGHVVVIGPILILDVRREPLSRMTDDLEYGKKEVALEGFPEMSPAEFVEMYCKANKCKSSQIVNRVQFVPQYEKVTKK